MRAMTILVAVAAAMAPVAAQAMTVAEFLAKAAALKQQGMLAIASPDIGLLTEEIKAAGADYRKGLAAQVAAGKKPNSCPPPVGKTGIGSNDLITYFSSLPPAKRTISVKTAFVGLMRQRFPCKG